MNTELEPQEPQISVSIAKLNAAELRVIQKWAVQRFEKFPTFGPWIAELIGDEQNRRQDPSIELAMVQLPKWTGTQLADCLVGSFVLCRLPLTPAIARWVDEIHKHIVADCSAALEQFGQVVT